MDGVEFATASWPRRTLRQVVTWRPVAVLSRRYLPSLDAFVARRTDGRRTVSNWLTGLPIVELETMGARSGQPRRTSVMAVPEDDGCVVVAANFGSSRQPAWYWNLRSNPSVTVRAGDAVTAMTARELEGQARERAFDRALRLNPGWARFADRAGGRTLPVFRLSPAGEDVVSAPAN